MIQTEEERFAEYLICKKRGHQSSGVAYITGVISKQRCKWCGTFYWFDQPTQRESGAPRDDSLTPEQEESLRSLGL